MLNHYSHRAFLSKKPHFTDMSFYTILDIRKTCFSKQHGVNSCQAVSRASKILSSEVTFARTSQSSSSHRSSIIFMSGDWGDHTMIVSIPEVCLFSKYLLHNPDVCSGSFSCCIMNPHIIDLSPKGTAWLTRMEWYPTLSSVPLILNNVPIPLSQKHPHTIMEPLQCFQFVLCSQDAFSLWTYIYTMSQTKKFQVFFHLSIAFVSAVPLTIFLLQFPFKVFLFICTM